MRLHTNALTLHNLYRAESVARVALVRNNEHGSRSHERAYEILLSGHSSYRINSGGYHTQASKEGLGDLQAATWDQWGIFLGSLYAVDPAMVVGSKSHPIYESAEHFHWTTSGRFDRWDWEESTEHLLHRWVYTGRSADGLYVVQECKGSKKFGECDAQTRRLTSMTWTDFQNFHRTSKINSLTSK